MNKPVDNRRRIRITTRFPWISSWIAEKPEMAGSGLLRGARGGSRNVSPLETGITWVRPRERGRSREAGPSHGYLAPAGGARRRRRQLAGRLGAAPQARPLHLIHGGALSDSARQETSCQARYPGNRGNAGRDDRGSGRARARFSGAAARDASRLSCRVCGEHPVPAVVGDGIQAQARSASCVPAASRTHRHADPLLPASPG